MAIRKIIKDQLPPKLRAKTGASRKTRTGMLDLSGDYLAAHAQSPVGAQITTEAATLKAARDALMARNGELTNIYAEADKKELEVVKAESAHGDAINEYAHRAAVIAKDDPAVLNGLGVQAAMPPRTSRSHEPVAMTGDLRVLPGANPGSATVRWNRPEGAGAFLVQYKLEPETPSAPPADWVPAEGFATRKVVWQIEGVPPAAHLRVRVRAIGAELGPWSEEVLGRAR